MDSAKGGTGADSFALGGDDAGQQVSFENRVILDGGEGTDAIRIGTLVPTDPQFPIEQTTVA